MKRTAALVCLAVVSTGAASTPATPPPPLADVESSLCLIGDAGVPAASDPVLRELTSQAARDPARSLIAFLGDNIYPRGMPAPRAPGRKEAERRLQIQIEAARASGASAIFVPGNHDWADRGSGWEGIRRQGAFVAEHGGGRITMEPSDGCPGPVVRDLGERLRVVAIDTEWWLYRGPKPVDPTSSCPADSAPEVLEALANAIRSAGERRVVVVAHHPLASGGTHGGNFTWSDHLFPLRARHPWLWIPLPGVGSGYPMARQRGMSNQDMSGRLNRKMREALAGVFTKHPPLVYAAGHEHNLQVLKGQDTPYLLVSGAGAFGHLTRVHDTRSTLFARTASGFMRIDVDKNGEARLAVVVVPGRGARPAEAFAKVLD
ncbi:MAG: hypothetical protein ABW221_28365 [Vicinamibacteria bacterium]